MPIIAKSFDSLYVSPRLTVTIIYYCGKIPQLGLRLSYM